ncbi:hypothetical protein ACX93W_26135 [Paenibacillus sp. CAU 1782]
MGLQLKEGIVEIRAVDSSYFEVLTNNNHVMQSILSHFYNFELISPLVSEVILIKKIIIVSVAIIAIILLFETVRTMSNPLYPSDSKLRSDFLEETPLGTSMDDVVHYIESKENWEVRYISSDHGFLHQRKTPIETVGVKSIRVFIGEYSSMFDLYFSTSVTVFYGFNEQSELIDIWVWKDLNAI